MRTPYSENLSPIQPMKNRILLLLSCLAIAAPAFGQGPGTPAYAAAQKVRGQFPSLNTDTGTFDLVTTASRRIFNKSDQMAFDPDLGVLNLPGGSYITGPLPFLLSSGTISTVAATGSLINIYNFPANAPNYVLTGAQVLFISGTSITTQPIVQIVSGGSNATLVYTGNSQMSGSIPLGSGTLLEVLPVTSPNGGSFTLSGSAALTGSAGTTSLTNGLLTLTGTTVVTGSTQLTGSATLSGTYNGTVFTGYSTFTGSNGAITFGGPAVLTGSNAAVALTGTTILTGTSPGFATSLTISSPLPLIVPNGFGQEVQLKIATTGSAAFGENVEVVLTGYWQQ